MTTNANPQTPFVEDAAAPLVERSAGALAAGVRAGELDPVEVVRAHLERIAACEGRLHAFEVVADAVALRDAEALRARGDLRSLPLAGVPVAIKDNVDVAALPTRHGSRATSAAAAPRDDELVARLRRAGAVVIGKTTMPELAVWPLTERDGREPTRNPWSLERTPGGSSGGSAVAVATGMAALALGSDGGGSIRVPAASCGIVGIKPTSGVVPLPGGRADHWRGCTAFGALARSVADAQLMLVALAGGDHGAAPIRRRLRIAVSARHPFAGAPVARAVRAALEDVAMSLAGLGHEIERAAPPYPPTPQAFVRCWLAGVAEDAAGVEPSMLEPRTRAMARHGERLRRHGWARDADAYRAGRRLHGWLERRDVVVTPILAQDPPPIATWAGRGWVRTTLGIARWMGYTSPWNVAGAPAVAVPVARSPAGLPIAVQLVGRRGSERLLLAVAAQLERLRPQPPWRPAA